MAVGRDHTYYTLNSRLTCLALSLELVFSSTAASPAIAPPNRLPVDLSKYVLHSVGIKCPPTNIVAETVSRATL